MQTKFASVIDRIAMLLDELEAGRYPGRAVVEDTMTDGYAVALALDGECARLERRISDVAVELFEDRGTQHAAELPGLAGMLTRRRRELDELRGLLASLKSLSREEQVA